VTRTLAATPLALFAFVTALVFAASAARTGLVPNDALALWAGAIMAGDGGLSIGSIVAAYPNIPFLATTFLEFITPSGTPTPALLAAALLGLMAGVWFHALRKAGFSPVIAATATLLLAFHPMILRAAVAGPSAMFLVAFLYLFGGALYDLRARGNISDVMAVGLALLGVAFSHPLGAAMAAASIPFLSMAVRPNLIARSAVNVVLTLAFPTIFAGAAFAYVSWVFPGDGWRFFTAPAESIPEWTASLSGLTGVAALDTAFVIYAAFILGAPFVVAAMIWMSRRRPLLAPALVFAVIAVTAAVLAVITGHFGEPGTVTVAVPVLAAIMLTRIPLDGRRGAIAVLLLVLGWFGGALGLVMVDPRAVTQIQAALQGRAGDQERIDALGLGGMTIGRDGILVDTFNAPAVVLGRGHSSGLLLPSGEPFAIAMLFSRIGTPFVAVPNPQSSAGAGDRLNKTFPFLYRDGPPGYRLLYHNNTWRLFGSQQAEIVRKN
jgi:hypothetical protein